MHVLGLSNKKLRFSVFTWNGSIHEATTCQTRHVIQDVIQDMSNKKFVDSKIQ